MPRQRSERVHGPYQHGNRWRVVFVAASGASTVESFASHAEAEAAAAAARALSGPRTVEEAVSAFLDAHNAGKASSNETARHRLFGLLRIVEHPSGRLSELTPDVARRLYARRSAVDPDTQRAEVRPDTHQGELAYAARFGEWCVSQG